MRYTVGSQTPWVGWPTSVQAAGFPQVCGVSNEHIAVHWFLKQVNKMSQSIVLVQGALRLPQASQVSQTPVALSLRRQTSSAPQSLLKPNPVQVAAHIGGTASCGSSGWPAQTMPPVTPPDVLEPSEVPPEVAPVVLGPLPSVVADVELVMVAPELEAPLSEIPVVSPSVLVWVPADAEAVALAVATLGNPPPESTEHADIDTTPTIAHFHRTTLESSKVSARAR